MTTTDEIDKFFETIEDHDIDFAGADDHTDVPVLTYRWCRNKIVARCPLQKLIEFGQKSMHDLGLKRVVCQGNHMRGDTSTGQRVKMTVLKNGQGSMYLLMTAGMPGTRDKARDINARLSKQIEQLASG
jgi:hypothetical protein